jgi:hypothetical protein
MRRDKRCFDLGFQLLGRFDWQRQSLPRRRALSKGA